MVRQGAMSTTSDGSGGAPAPMVYFPSAPATGRFGGNCLSWRALRLIVFRSVARPEQGAATVTEKSILARHVRRVTDGSPLAGSG